MKILSLELINYRPFKHQLIDFNRDGVIGIIGRNGAGKTTIVEAIMWGLYGDFRQARTDRQGIRLQSADEDEHCEVILEIQLAGHLCKIDRMLRGKEQKHELEVHLAAFKRDEEFAQTNFDRLNSGLAEAKQRKREVEELRRRLEMLSKLEALMSKFREWYSTQLRPQVEHEASDLLLSMTQGKYPRIQLSSDYQLAVYDGSRLHPLHYYSGGEIDLVNLCLRIALTRIAARKRGVELGVIMFDEIFGSQDQERRQELLTQFRQMHNYFRQVLLITHVDDIAAGFVDHVLRVTRSDEGISSAEFEFG